MVWGFQTIKILVNIYEHATGEVATVLMLFIMFLSNKKNIKKNSGFFYLLFKYQSNSFLMIKIVSVESGKKFKYRNFFFCLSLL